jgi:hypothetical protein
VPAKTSCRIPLRSSGHDNLAADVIEDAYLVVGTEYGKQLAVPGLTDDLSHGNGNTVGFLRTISIASLILIRTEYHCASHRNGPPTKEVAGSFVPFPFPKWLLPLK